jgi:hypothetical protein
MTSYQGKGKKSATDSLVFSSSFKHVKAKDPDDLLSNHSDSPSHRSEESIHSTDNYHYVKKIIKYRDNPLLSSDSDESGKDSGDSLKFKSSGYKIQKFPSKKEKKHKKSPKFQKPFEKIKKKPGKNQRKSEKNRNFFEKEKKIKKKRVKEKTDPVKDDLINRILRRWWYALDEWPPEGFNYSEVLKKQKFRLVHQDSWSSEPNVNHGFTKVMQLPGYPGVYVLPNGYLKDLRPEDSCPSYHNLYKKPVKELKEILLTAINCQINQVRELKDNDLADELISELKEIKSKF